MGEDAHHIWGELLKGNRDKTFSLLVLMGYEIRGEQIEEQTGFWKYVFDHRKLDQILDRDFTDEKGNSLFHYCASAESGEQATKLLKILPCESFTDLHEYRNRNLNNILHVAMRTGKCGVFHALMDRFNKRNYSCYLHPWLKKILTELNADKETVFSTAIKSKMSDATIIGMIRRLYDSQIRELCKVKDRRGNTILHLATKFGRDELVQHLATKPINEMLPNYDGQTALHVAVQYDNLNTVKIFYKAFRNRKIDINQTTSDRETAMHIEAKIGSTEMMTLLVNLGGDYAARDEDGNTPLHHLLEFISLEGIEKMEDKTEVFRKAWNATVENSVIWWCNRLDRRLPEHDSILYQQMKQDAMYSLRSEITDKMGLTVLEYAATLGLPECVQIMLTHKKVFITEKSRKNEKENYEKKGQKMKRAKKAKPEYEIDVSNLIPEFSCRIKTTYDTRYGRDLLNILKEKPTEKATTGERSRSVLRKIGKRPRNFLDTLSKVKPSNKISEELGSFPMAELAKRQWFLYQIFIIVTMMLHIVAMAWYTYESQTVISGQNGTRTIPNKNGFDGTSSDFIMMVYVTIIGSIFLVSFLYSKIRRWIKGTVIYGDLEPFSVYVEEEGAFLNSVTHIVAFIAENLPKIVPLVFTILAILLFFFSRYPDSFTVEHYLWMKGGVILTGWIIILLQARAYSPIYNFISVLKYIFVKDMVPFLLFYSILSIAFGCAIQLQFQLLGQENVQQDEFGSISTFGNFLTSVPFVVWELFIMTEGLDTNLRHVQNVGYLFELERFRSFMIELLLFVYGLISTIILLNMLIAAMSTTYSDVIQKQGRGWRQYQVCNPSYVISGFKIIFQVNTSIVVDSAKNHPIFD